ncbi:SDR family oxidoreductase [Kerstersia gyiorum]|uniref:SDR family oxidoreductase n=1 Tax=Kerstersia gyiorum TaxID=206506 RepID=UPI0020A12E78|nr:SDR family oxidoreductase [Kerstersia gyiorum]MCP1633152.1 2,3-dihydro-2,3-dihydroxybenzoate dehydrogenase [Kerstersia gyiorum]MCP1636401.1 2,3-dihydro-2,3-dihydroxybenzoate dehydrogenase [Kerstersia gyiorum]MCP1670346.1 2,3-dihydro-2,3-dihydroxybenzoate dehydrogenase [Kerstersia gyiorum]MCP1680379.1 2,3-dihydro-2,3-dihydroxybenzoate dehydrogenase [Kerstersia gyiorum]MCP1682671.1 2,3-dihydro-2,3-dihydroxybenzoate dehydrogenase [Kerstersia gyiorum]
MSEYTGYQGYDDEFSGVCVAISGAAGGVGHVLARRLLRAGAKVAAFDQLGESLQPLASDAGPAQLHMANLDVSDAAAVELAVAAAEQMLGPVEKLVSAASLLQIGRIVDVAPAHWARAFEVNTMGAFNFNRIVASGMMARRRGAIVNIGSSAAATPRAGMGAYAASMAAVAQLTRCLALELAGYGVRCNIVSPGDTETIQPYARLQQGLSREKLIEGELAHYRLGIPLRKLATADEVADAVLFLLSDRASHITLHDLCVDGGATLDQ